MLFGIALTFPPCLVSFQSLFRGESCVFVFLSSCRFGGVCGCFSCIVLSDWFCWLCFLPFCCLILPLSSLYVEVGLVFSFFLLLLFWGKVRGRFSCIILSNCFSFVQLCCLIWLPPSLPALPLSSVYFEVDLVFLFSSSAVVSF